MASHSVEIIRKFQYSIRAECSCGWKHIEFLHDDKTKVEAYDRFDVAVKAHEDAYK